VLNDAEIVVQTQHVCYVSSVFNTVFTDSTNTGWETLAVMCVQWCH